MASQDVRVSTLRLPPSVHGDGERGVSAYVGDGLNRWPAVHRLDAARLYRLALEKGTAGARYHGVADEGVPFRQITEVIGRRLKVPVTSKTPEESADHFGWISHFVSIDCPSARLGVISSTPPTSTRTGRANRSSASLWRDIARAWCWQRIHQCLSEHRPERRGQST
jgi:nucleoside-diphosphate-sugar epimerase